MLGPQCYGELVNLIPFLALPQRQLDKHGKEHLQDVRK